MTELPLPTLPPLPPPIGSRVEVTTDDQPPPPARGAKPLPAPPIVDRVLSERYKPPVWLSAERRLEKDGALTAKGVVLGIGAIVVMIVLTIVVLAFMVGGDTEFEPIDQEPVSFSMTGANDSITSPLIAT